MVDSSSAIRRAQRGDEEAFRRVYRSVRPRLLRYLRVLVGDDAEDVASETWLQIDRDLTSFSGDEEAFRGWVATVARNRAVDHLRQRRRRPVAEVGVDQVPALASGDDTAALAIDNLSTKRAVALIASR